MSQNQAILERYKFLLRKPFLTLLYLPEYPSELSKKTRRLPCGIHVDLRALQEHDLIIKRQDYSDARKQIYALTEEGMELRQICRELKKALNSN